MNIAFILGAGASHEAGVPLLDNFLPVMFTEVKNHYSNIKDKFENLEEYISKNIGKCNVEELLSLLDFLITIKLDDFNELARRKDLKELIIKTLKYSLRNENSNVMRKYGEFGAFVKSNEASVITFNWDLLLDPFFNYNYGSKKLIPANTSVVQLTSKSFLLKLHGSINWEVPKKNQENIKFYEWKLDFDGNLEPLIVFPSHMKFYKVDFETTDINPFLGEIWLAAFMELALADHIFIIGFSFPDADQHFRLFFKHTIKTNIEKWRKIPKIHVITRPKRLIKEKIEFEERYNKIMENMEVEPKFYYITFFDFIESVLVPSVNIKEEYGMNRMLGLLQQHSK